MYMDRSHEVVTNKTPVVMMTYSRFLHGFSHQNLLKYWKISALTDIIFIKNSLYTCLNGDVVFSPLKKTLSHN